MRIIPIEKRDKYIDNDYRFVSRSRPTNLNGKMVKIETYEKHYNISQRPKFIFLAIRDLFRTLGSLKYWPKAQEDWRAVFSGKKIAVMHVPVEEHIPFEGEVEFDEERKEFAENFVKYIQTASPNHQLTEDEFREIQKLNSEQMEALINDLEGSFKDILTKEFVDVILNAIDDDAISQHATLQNFDGSIFKVVFKEIDVVIKNDGEELELKEIKRWKCTIDICASENENSVSFINQRQEYPLSIDTLEKISAGYAKTYFQECCKENIALRKFVAGGYSRVEDIISVRLREF